MIKVEIEEGLVSHWNRLPQREVRKHWRVCAQKKYILTASTEALMRIHYMEHEK